jgi:hypothetical protein
MRNGCRLIAALVLVLTAFPLFGAEVVSPREPFFGLEKVQLRIEHKNIATVATRIHRMFSRHGWYRVEPGQSLLEICDSAERLDAIEQLVLRIDTSPRDVAFEVSLLTYTGGKATAPVVAAEPEADGPKLRALNRRIAQKKAANRETLVGQKSLTAREGQFVEFPMGQGYNVAFRVGYFDRTKEVIELNKLVFSRSTGRAADPGAQEQVILSTDLKLGEGVKHLLTMRKPGCQDYYTLAIRASLGDEPAPRGKPARDADDLPVREWP